MGCGRKTAAPAASNEAMQPAAFAADSAYRYIADQVAFGPRVPGTDAHRRCAQWLEDELARHGAEVSVQTGSLPNYRGEQQPIHNIIGRFFPDAQQRVLLCAHWDCRPWADQEDPSQPVLGANDAASGVGVLLEIARQLGTLNLEPLTLNPESSTLPLGVDIVFFDAEDMGTPDFYDGPLREDTWCLGSQLWSHEYVSHKTSVPDVHTTPSPFKGEGTGRGSAFLFGILLDMVASPGAVFPKEYYSMQYASPYVERIWHTAQQLGYGRFFRNQTSYPLTDDHYYVNSIAHIPCIDIIHYDRQSGTGFPAYWHTTHDDMSNVSLETLDAVGRTVLTVLLNK